MIAALLLAVAPCFAAPTALPPAGLTALKGWLASPSAPAAELLLIMRDGAVADPAERAAVSALAAAKVELLRRRAEDWATPQARMAEAVAALRAMSGSLSGSVDTETDGKAALAYMAVRNHPMMTAAYRAEQLAKRLMDAPGQDVVFGEMAVRKTAPGARQLVRALSHESEMPVLGMFRPSTAEVINAFPMGELGLGGHAQAAPPQLDRRDAGGYTLLLRRDGRPVFRGSGKFPAEITPRVERSILSYLGLRPARETGLQRARRLALRAWDAFAAWMIRYAQDARNSPGQLP